MLNKQKLEIILPKFEEEEDWIEVVNDTNDSHDSDGEDELHASFSTTIDTSISISIAASSSSNTGSSKKQRVIPENRDRGFKFPLIPTVLGSAKKYVRPLKDLLKAVVKN